MSEKKGKVFWTDLEAERVTEALVNVLANKPPVYGKRTIGDCLVDAQFEAGLPEERLRSAKYVSSNTLLGKIVLTAQRRAKIRATAAAKQAKEEAESAAQAVAEEKPAVIVEIPKHVLPDVAATLAKVPASLLMAQLAERFFRWVNDSQNAWLGRGGRHTVKLNESVAVPLLPQKVVVQREFSNEKPRVAVVGLLKDQFERVVGKAPSNLELVFVDKDRSETSFPVRTDYVVQTRHSGHRWTEAAQQHVGNSRVRWAEGSGDSAVVKELFDIASVEAARKS